MPVISRFYGIVIKMYLRQKKQIIVKKFIKQNREKLLQMWNTQIFEELFLIF